MVKPRLHLGLATVHIAAPVVRFGLDLLHDYHLGHSKLVRTVRVLAVIRYKLRKERRPRSVGREVT